MKFVESLRQRLDRLHWGGRLVLTVWLIGMAIRLADVFLIRPLCPFSIEGAAEGTGRCLNLFNDNGAMFGAAQLIRHGNVGYNPLYYVLSGGGLAPTIGKPPITVLWMALVAWFGSGSMIAVVIAEAILVAGVYYAVRFFANKRAASITAQVLVVVLIGLRIAGGDSVMTIRVACVLFASAAIPLSMVYAHRIGGTALAVVVGLIVAVNPAIWANDSMMNVEVSVVVAVPLLLLAHQYLLDTWSPIASLGFGLACAWAAFSRYELMLAVVALALGTVIAARSHLRLALIRVGTGMVVFVISMASLFGWSGSRSNTPGGGLFAPLGSVLIQSACDNAFYGGSRGLYDISCISNPKSMTVTRPIRLGDAVDQLVGAKGYGDDVMSPDNPVRNFGLKNPPLDIYPGVVPRDPAKLRASFSQLFGYDDKGRLGVGVTVDGKVNNNANEIIQPGHRVTFVLNMAYLAVDEKRSGGILARRAFVFLNEHRSDLPETMAIRVARVFGLYRLHHSIEVNAHVEGQGLFATIASLPFVWASLLATPFAIRIMRRRRLPWFPPLAFGIQMLLVVAGTYGIMRYRASWDVASAVYLGVVIVGAKRLRPRSEDHAVDEIAAGPESLAPAEPAPAETASA